MRLSSDSILTAPEVNSPNIASIQIKGCTFGKTLVPRPSCQNSDQNQGLCTRRYLPDTISHAELGSGPVLYPTSPVLPALKSPNGAICQKPRGEVTPDLWMEYSGHFFGINKIPIAYKIVRKVLDQGDQPLVVILPGYNENILLYTETLTDFLNQGFEVAIMDHRGMGLSGRFPMMQNIGYIDEFSNYVSDAQFFVEQVVKKNPKHTFLLGHSTGGLIGAQLMAKRPGLFAGAVLLSPLMELLTGAIPSGVACGLVNVCAVIGKGHEYAPGCSLEKERAVTFSTNQSTQSELRFKIKKEIIMKNPKIELGPPSNRWLQAVYQEVAQISNLGKSITTPTLLIQAGQDTIVGRKGQEIFCKEARNSCKLVRVDGAFHGIHLEKNDLRDSFLQESFSFIKGLQ